MYPTSDTEKNNQFHYENAFQMHVVPHTYNLHTWEDREADCKFEYSLSDVVRPSLKEKPTHS